MKEITIRRPDDWHIHLRDHGALNETVPSASRYFARAIVMPNLQTSIVNCQQAAEYKTRIEAALPAESQFTPLMTLYLTDNTTAEEALAAAKSKDIKAFKLYPAGATTNSDAGVTSIEKTYDAISVMESEGLPLLLHGEITRSEVDIFDREKVFIDEMLEPLISRFPKLKVVLEHITTKDAANFVKQANTNLAATITPHHLLFNRNHMLVGGIRPHLYCLPILKRNIHQEALLEAATSGDPSFFLGTDSAPHARTTKESACGCAGIYSAPAAIELYAEAFEAHGKLDQLEKFSSENGANFYQLPLNNDTIKLVKESWIMPDQFEFVQDGIKQQVIPMRAGETIHWKIASDA